MKEEIAYDVLRKIKANPNLKRKIKIFVAIGVISILLTAALAVWAGVSAFNYIASKTDEVINSPSTSVKIENLKTEVKDFTKLQALNCWVKAQSLMAIEPWLARSALENLNNLKTACLEETTQPAKDASVLKLKN